jgi:aspartyl-tRNA(Asn)/glutamyl-tRNA(Gln) amidotransferase subunit B
MLPEKKRDLYSKYNVSSDIIESIISDQTLDSFFTKVIGEADRMADRKESVIKLAANYLSVDIAGLQTSMEFDVSTIDSMLFVDLMFLVESGEIGSRNAKDLLPDLPHLTGDIKAIAIERGLLQKSDKESLIVLVRQIITQNQEQVDAYRNGKEPLLKYLVGQGMKLSKGTANPQVLEKLLVSEITK